MTEVSVRATSTTAGRIVTIAEANRGKHACSANSAGGKGFYTSCTGAGGRPEAWCADFVKWVWAQAGVNVEGLTPAAGSFGTNGRAQGPPQAGGGSGTTGRSQGRRRSETPCCTTTTDTDMPIT